MVNYRDLLVKYINHVIEISGSDEGFISDEMPEEFDEEETLMLKLLKLEADALWQSKTIIKEK